MTKKNLLLTVTSVAIFLNVDIICGLNIGRRFPNSLVPKSRRIFSSSRMRSKEFSPNLSCEQYDKDLLPSVATSHSSSTVVMEPRSVTMKKSRRSRMIKNRVLRNKLKLYHAGRTTKQNLQKFKSSWWTLPFLILIKPVHSIAVLNEMPQMPSWWPFIPIPDHKLQQIGLIIMFLASNFAYFGAGSFLRFQKQQSPDQKYPELLFKLVLMAGTVSLLYHFFQALGAHGLAQTFCYLDHAVAFAAGLYFLNTCGWPSYRTWGVGVISLLALSHKGSLYLEIHSLWHFLSSVTIISWANDR